jgi:hypothetical protein
VKELLSYFGYRLLSGHQSNRKNYEEGSNGQNPLNHLRDSTLFIRV